jgi:uncharacterized membrane protein YbhN (UPF0104 family)
MSQKLRRSTAIAVAGTLLVAVLLAVALAGREHQFAVALHAAPIWVLLVAAALQLVALVSRCEAWHRCVAAAGGTISRRRLYRAGGAGNLGSVLNTQVAAAARIAVLRRSAPGVVPRIPALIAAEAPILVIEGALAAIASFTLVGPLGLPWWLPLVALTVAGGIVAVLGRLAGRGRGMCVGLAVLRNGRGRIWVGLFVFVAVFAQITRNWLILHALGVDASLLDATAVLIAMVTLGQLPIGPSVGAAAVVAILGANGVAATAAAGVLLTATGTVGALCFALWAGVDLLAGRLSRATPARAAAAPVPAPRPARAPAAVRG